MNYQSGEYFTQGQGGELDRPVGIYVEGIDDAHFIDRLLTEVGADQDQVRLVYTGGVNQMDTNLISIKKSRAYTTGTLKKLLIIRDADTDATKTQANITAALHAAGFPDVPHDQLIEYDQQRSVGVFIIPSNERKGAVEELLLDTVEEDAKLQAVRKALEEVEADNEQLNKRGKRLMQMYLAVCDPICKGGGIGLKHGHFPVTHQALAPIKGFLSRAIAIEA